MTRERDIVDRQSTRPNLRDKSSTHLILALPEVLKWANVNEFLTRTHGDYIQQLAMTFGQILAQTRKADQEKGERLLRDAQEANDETLLRVLTAPETSYRLLWSPPGVCYPEFFYWAFLAERARNGEPMRPDREIWTPLGDTHVRPDGRVTTTTPVTDRIAVDSDSPQVTSIDLSGRRQRRTVPLSAEECSVSLDRLQMGYAGVVATSQTAKNLVANFLKVFVLQKKPSEPVFLYGSSQTHIGRVAITNPHLVAVDEVRIAEAMVHEAIHSLLYILVQSHPWGLTDFYEVEEPRITSPWTGTRLLLSTYLHACFVWYGLIHFWSLVLQVQVFEVERVAPRLARATVGFLGQPLLAALESPHRIKVMPAIGAAIEEMQECVVNASKELRP